MELWSRDTESDIIFFANNFYFSTKCSFLSLDRDINILYPKVENGEKYKKISYSKKNIFDILYFGYLNIFLLNELF